MNKLESQIHEIEQCNNDAQPGAYKSDRASSKADSESLDELHTELESLSAGLN